MRPTVGHTQSGVLRHLAAVARQRTGHLTPLYLVDRVMQVANARRHPDAPWLNRQAVDRLSTLLRPTDVGVEWGSGRSTLWLARRTMHVLSIEHDRRWHEHVVRRVGDSQLANVDARWVDLSGVAESDAEHRYAEQPVAEVSAGSVDYVLVDGLYRDACAQVAVDLLRLGGLLVLDNAERYLPHPTRSPERLRTPIEPGWAAFRERVRDWRHLWTSDGVTDTAFWIKSD